MTDIGMIVLVLIILFILGLICSVLYALLLKFVGPGTTMMLMELARESIKIAVL